jgi:hypothetical protein
VSLRSRVAAVAAIAVVLAFTVFLFVAAFLRNRPPAVGVTTKNGETSLTLQTVGQLGHGSRADWVSYLARKPDGSWDQSTTFELPAHSTIHVTVYQFDTQTGLRNPFLGKVQGTVGGTMTVDGKQLSVLDPVEAAHTFSIPDLGVSVPLEGISASAPKQCSLAPCSTDFDHVTVEFTLKTGAPGKFRWQCFVPCALGTLSGNGGPMQTVGFMGGFVVVV